MLTVVARATGYAEAIARAYTGVALVSFDGMQYRRDIGRKAIHESAIGDLYRQSFRIETKSA